MIDWSKKVIEGLGVALNEATLLGVEMDLPAREVGVTLQVLSLPELGPASYDSRVVLALRPVGRLVASLRHGLWNDATAAVEPFPIESLFDVVRSFHGCDIYGWDFFDSADDDFNVWASRLSLDWRTGEDGQAHTLDLFQEGADKGQRRHLDLRLWFDDMTIYTLTKAVVPVDEFIAGGRRWCVALRNGDPRTNASSLIS